MSEGDGNRVVVGRRLPVGNWCPRYRDSVDSVEEETSLCIGDVVYLDIANECLRGGFCLYDDGVIEEVVSPCVA